MLKKFISHRGNLYEKDLNRENKIESIFEVISMGYDCEVDLRYIDEKIFLGHDSPNQEIEISIISEIKESIWIHCKNLAMLNYFVSLEDADINYFWHQNDDFTLTSKNYIWTYPGKDISKNSVIVDLNHKYKIKDEIFGLCSDNIHYAKDLYS